LFVIIEKKEKRLLLILLGVEKLLQNESVVAKIVFTIISSF